MTAIIVKDSVFEDTGNVFMARVKGIDGNYILQADLSSITYAVFNMTTGSAVAVINDTVTISTAVFDTLQTDGIWTWDTTGYNFLHVMPATAFPTGGNVYAVEYTFTPASGPVFKQQFLITARPVYS